MIKKRILSTCILAAFAITLLAPVHLLAVEDETGVAGNQGNIQPADNGVIMPDMIPDNCIANEPDDFFVPDGFTPFDFIILPDWRGGDRIVYPIMIKNYLKHKLSHFLGDYR